MAKSFPITSITHQVAICGRVVIGYKATGEQKGTVLPDPVRQVQVEIIKAPERFQRQLYLKSLSYGQQWESLADRPDRTHTAIDGSFYFLDLPPGTYTLRATVPQTGTYLKAAEKVVTVVDTQKLEWQELRLATTGIIGQVLTQVQIQNATDQSQVKTENIPVAYAQVDVHGGTEKTRCDRDGKFQLLNLNTPEVPSTRSVELEISALGYETFTIKDITLSRGIVQRIEPIQLAKKSQTKANGTKP